MGVGVGATHYLPLVLKHLDPLVGPAQLRNLIGPFINDSSYLGQFHERKSEVRARVETHDPTSESESE